MEKIMQEVQQLINSKDDGFKNFKAKCVGLYLAPIALAELMMKGMANRSGIVIQIEDTIIEKIKSGDLTDSEVKRFCSIWFKSLTFASDYVQKASSIDWVKLESELISLSENKGSKVDQGVTRGAEYFLKKMSELKEEGPNKISPENIIAKALNLAAPKDEVDPKNQ